MGVSPFKANTTQSLFIESTLSVPNVELTLLGIAVSIHVMIKEESKFEDDAPEELRPLTNLFDERNFLTESEIFRAPTNETPPVAELYEYVSQLYSIGEFSAECCVISLVLLVRFLNRASLPLRSWNCRLIVLTASLIAQKVWDDRALANGDFPKLFYRAAGGDEEGAAEHLAAADAAAAAAAPATAPVAEPAVMMGGADPTRAMMAPAAVPPAEAAVGGAGEEAGETDVTRLTGDAINAMEKAFVQLLRFDVTVPPGEYTVFFLELRELALLNTARSGPGGGSVPRFNLRPLSEKQAAKLHAQVTAQQRRNKLPRSFKSLYYPDDMSLKKSGRKHEVAAAAEGAHGASPLPAARQVGGERARGGEDQRRSLARSATAGPGGIR